MRNKVVLLLCGSFNPITNMHLRMFELAQDYFRENNKLEIIGGIISPVHDSYPKKGLQLAVKRSKMIQLAIKQNPFLIMDNWEISQPEWTRTRLVLENLQKRLPNDLFDEYQNHPSLKKIMKSSNGHISKKWIENIDFSEKIVIKLLCGADLVESFSIPGLWSQDDINYILQNHGLVVIGRGNFDTEKFIYEHDTLYEMKNNIDLIKDWITMDISSTKVRRSLSRSQSVKYLIPDVVIEYIKENNLYEDISKTTTANSN